ncbi:MAG: hypothetical protein E7398_05055 [Ruminococcaceae bacterium]|nr:hypothetical protein [Oscillospiraceae bacterium]
MNYKLTKEKKEQLLNRLVLNFGILLIGAFLMLYVNGLLRGSYSKLTYTIILVLGILGAVSAVLLFVLGKKKNLKLKNYSAVGIGVFVAAIILYISKFNLFSFYSKSFAVALVYILMLVYFIILAVYTKIMTSKPLVKDSAALKKNKKKRK